MDDPKSSLESLTSQFLSKLVDIRTLLDLTQASDDEEKEQYMAMLDQCVLEKSGLAQTVRCLREEVERQRKELDRFKLMKEKLTQRQAILEHCVANIPAHLPRLTSAAPDISEENQKQNRTKEVKNHTGNSKQPRSSSPPNNKQHASKSVYVPALEYITVQDFETVPKYMKGRITYTQINNAIDELNKAYKEKYKILAMKRSALSDVNRKRYESYKQQETKETSDEHFIIDADIKEFANFKLDSVGRNILTILRHCGRMKEIRGGGRTRYAIIQVY